MRTKQDYIKGLSRMKRNIYYDGQLIDRTDELQMRCLNTIGTTYEEAEKPENSDLMTAISHLTGERINRFTHIHQNKEDLHKKQDMTRMLCQKVGGCIQRCMGIDAINAATKDQLLKYTKRNPKMSPEDQAQFWRFLGDALCSATGGIRNIGAYHGGGSPIMEQIAITTQYDIESRKKLVKYIAGMSGGDREALSSNSKTKK